jgi:hypothetical protein
VSGEDAPAAKGDHGRLAGPWSICTDISAAYQPAGLGSQTTARHESTAAWVLARAKRMTARRWGLSRAAVVGHRRRILTIRIFHRRLLL